MHIGSGSVIGMKRGSGFGDMDSVVDKDSGKDKSMGGGAVSEAVTDGPYC